MTREEKNNAIADLTTQLQEAGVVYLADISNLDAGATTKLRRSCFSNNIGLHVVKNTLLKKAMDNVEDKEFGDIYNVLKGNTALMISEIGNAPAKLIKEFRKKSDRPLLKAAYIEESVYVGDEMINALADLKSKEELIGEVITLLQSPAKNVISSLQSSGQTLTGVLKTLAERE